MWMYAVQYALLWTKTLVDAYTYKEPRPEGEVAIPHTEEGTGIPLLFGRCRVRQPILAACTDPNLDWAVGSSAHDQSDPVDYGIDMLFVLGIPFSQGVHKLLKIYVGDQELVTPGGNVRLDQLTGYGQASPVTQTDDPLRSGLTFERAALVQHIFDNDQGVIGGRVEFLNGYPSQEVADNAFPYTPKTFTAQRLTTAAFAGAPTIATPAGSLPGFRGYLSAFVFDFPLDYNHQWQIGRAPQTQPYSFEVSTYTDWGAFNTGPFSPVDADANPADVIYELLTGTFGKLALDPARIDYNSIINAAATLFAEGHGFSRSFEAGTPAREMIKEVLEQIGGVLYEDTRTGLLVLKLIRQDYLPSGAPVIDVGRGARIENFRILSASSAIGLPNKIRVTFTDRLNGFRPGSAQTHNLVGAVGQSTEATEVVLDFPGINRLQTARDVAARELDMRSRPLKACTAIVDKRFRHANPTDVVRLVWKDLGTTLLMRVIGRSGGGPGDNSVRLELVQEFFLTSGLEPDPAVLPGHGTDTPVAG